MKSRIQLMMLACMALTGAFFASCTDDALMEASENYAGRPFELTVHQPSNGSRLAFDGTDLTFKWTKDDQLVLVDKSGYKSPIYLSTALEEPAASATFVSESAVPDGEYHVIYNYNDKMIYGHTFLQSVENLSKDFVLYGTLVINNGQYSRNIQLAHLYSMIRLNITGAPQGQPLQVGMYSSKKGMPIYKKFTANGLVNVEKGIRNGLGGTEEYFESSRTFHNLPLGTYDPNASNASSYSALILPNGLQESEQQNEKLFFYLMYGDTCYEIMKDGVDFQPGVCYTVNLNLQDVVPSVLNQSMPDPTNPRTIIQIGDIKDWRHAAYRNDYSIYELTDDLNFAGDYFFPIRAEEIKGNNKKISNITLAWAEDNVGLIRHEWSLGAMNEILCTNPWNQESEVSDLTLENVNFSGGDCVGAFGGHNVALNNCVVIGTSSISGSNYVGGAVGCNTLNKDMAIQKVSVGQSCQINGNNNVGGIIGGYVEDGMGMGLTLDSSLGLLESCASKARVVSTGDYVGGIFGRIGEHKSVYFQDNAETKHVLTITKCINTGTVTGKNYVGGIGGEFAIYSNDNSMLDRVVLKESYSEGKVKGEQKVAGLLGASMASINTCYTTDSIIATTSEVAGIVGYMDGMINAGTARVANCYSLAGLKVGSADGKIGGIIANSGRTTITNCYYAADPTKNSFGGIVGYSDGGTSVKNCVTTLTSLGNNLNPNKPTTDNDYDGIPDAGYSDTIGAECETSVDSIQEYCSVINKDEQKYSTTTIWDTTKYPWNCVKFDSFGIGVGIPGFGQDSI